MRKTTILLALGLLGLTAVVGLWGCSPDSPSAPDVPLTSGDMRVARPVVSIGNSLTAGHINSGLEIWGQLASFPNVLSSLVSEELSGVPGGIRLSSSLPVYMQLPLIYAGENPLAEQQFGIGSTTAPDGVTPLTGLYVNNSGQITANPLPPTSTVLGWLKNASYPLAYDNLGVPGAYAADLLNATSSANSVKPGNAFFDFILRNSQLPPFNATEVIQLDSHFTKETIVGVDGTGAPIYSTYIPRVITVWAGGNDILLGASGGNPVVGENITPSSDFENSLVAILDQVAAMAAVGNSMVALGNMQTRLPYFDTVPLTANVGGTPVRWVAEETDYVYVLLTATGLSGFPGAAYLPGGGQTLPSNVTLSAAEWDDVLSELQAYNQIIADQASSRGYALADINAALSTLPATPGPGTAGVNGLFGWVDLTGDGQPEQNAYSAFSLDGIHPTEKGYCVIANTFAAALNTTYGTTIGSKDVSTVQNLAGFEQVSVAPPTARKAGTPLFTANGVEALRGALR